MLVIKYVVDTPNSCKWMLGIHKLHFDPSDHERPPVVPLVINALNLTLLKYKGESCFA